MTTVPAPQSLPQWLVDAVVGLVASAYAAGRQDAVVTTPEPVEQPHDSYTLAEAAKGLKIGMTKLNRLVVSGELGSFYIGRKRYVHHDDLQAYLAKRRTA